MLLAGIWCVDFSDESVADKVNSEFFEAPYTSSNGIGKMRLLNR